MKYSNATALFRASLTTACIVICLAAASVSAQVKKPAAPASVRTVTVITEPNATVWIDGVKYGKTAEDGRLTVSTVAAGKRAFRVRADGFKEITKPVLATQKGDISFPLAKTTDEAELAYQQGEILSTSNRETAAAAYNKAVKLRPDYAEAYIGLARLYSEARDAEKAEAAIKSIRRIRPRSAEASVIEGRTLKEAGEDDKAIASFKRAIAAGGGFQPEAYTGLGLIYKERAENDGGNADFDGESANYTEAAKHFTTALKQLSGGLDAPAIYQFLGLVYEQQKKYKEAISVYKEYLRYFPSTPESPAFESFIVQLEKQMNKQK